MGRGERKGEEEVRTFVIIVTIIETIAEILLREKGITCVLQVHFLTQPKRNSFLQLGTFITEKREGYIGGRGRRERRFNTRTHGIEGR